MHKFLSILIVIGIFSVAQAQDSADVRTIDSLNNILRNLPFGFERLEALDKIAELHYNADSTIKFAEEEIALAQQLNEPAKIANGLRYLSWAQFYLANYQQAKDNLYNAIEIYDSLADAHKLAVTCSQLASTLMMMSENVLADMYYRKSLKIFIEQADSFWIAGTYRNLGNVCLRYELYETANDYFRQALDIDFDLESDYSIAEDYCNIGESYENMYVKKRADTLLVIAKRNLYRAYNLANRVREFSIMQRTLEFLAEAYTMQASISRNPLRQHLLDSSYNYFNKNFELINKLGFEDKRLQTNMKYVRYFIVKNDIRRAKQLLDSLNNSIDTLDNVVFLNMLYQVNIEYYKAIGDLQTAMIYTDKCAELESRRYAEDIMLRTAQMHNEIEFDRQLRERETAQREMNLIYQARVARQRIVSIFSLLGLLLVSAFAVMVHKANKRYHRVNEQLEQQNAVVSHANQQIKESIQYAKRIQSAVIPSEEIMHILFADCVIYFRPLNTVSGDFYWAAQYGRYEAITVADCTGHGVPGALMSMLGMSILNEIATSLTDAEKPTAAGILEQLRIKLIGALRQRNIKKGRTYDGMDMAFCLIDNVEMTLQFAGAYRPLLLIRDGKMVVYEGDRMPVGVHYLQNEPFHNIKIDIKKDDILYMYSDGFSTQPGQAPENIKFGEKRVREMISRYHNLPFDQQLKKFDQIFDDWRKPSSSEAAEIEQFDDVLIVGVKI